MHISHRTIAYAAISLLGLSTLPDTALSQTYTKQVILSNLVTPRGIAVDVNGDLYYTEVPTPGVPGTMGGTNTVSRLDTFGTITVVGNGMPEPLNIAIRGSDVFWTCRTAGVLFRYSPTAMGPYATGLTNPTGVASSPSGELYITQVPTPGVPGSMGGGNTVDMLGAMGMAPVTISAGQPEPADVVVDLNGNGYWTCRTAGVILRKDGATGAISMLLKGLQRPTGIAADAQGAIYFTEVPTPGVPGSMGGGNKVSRFDPLTHALSLISVGEPEPYDIAVTADGKSVYWTCSTAGVIVRADRVGPTPQVRSLVDAVPGVTAMFQLDAPGEAGNMYFAASSLTSGPIPVDTRYIALGFDALLSGTLLDAGAPFVSGYVGFLDNNGQAIAQLALPSMGGIIGLDLHTAFAIHDPSAANGIGAISSTNVERID